MIKITGLFLIFIYICSIFIINSKKGYSTLQNLQSLIHIYLQKITQIIVHNTNHYSLISMPTKKDEGNTYYQSGKYKQAIQCYQEYLNTPHKDNSKAYNNMALAMYKLKEFQKCVQACEMSIQLEPQFEKPYYRMYEAYKEMKDWYNVLIVGERFMKMSKDEKEIIEMRKDWALVKGKLCEKISNQYVNQKNKKKVSEEDKVIQEIIHISIQQTDFKDTQTKSIKQTQPTSLQQKWEQIQNKIRENNKKGVNLAWKFILQECSDEQTKHNYKKLLTKVKSINKKSELEAIDEKKKKNQDLQSGYDSQPSSQQQLEKVVQNNVIAKIKIQKPQKQQQSELSYQAPVQDLLNSTIQSINDNDHTQISFSSPTQIEGQLAQFQKALNQRQTSALNQASHNQFLIQQNNQIKKPSQSLNDSIGFILESQISSQQLQILFIQNVKSKMLKSRDQLASFYNCLISIITSTFSKLQKQALLRQIPKRLKNFKILTNFSKKQGQILKQKAEQHKLGQSISQLYFLSKSK